MKDILVPIGIMTFLGVFVYALVSSARTQRRAKAVVFSDFARLTGLCYKGADDGKAQRFARDLGGIGQFHSPSLGDRIPADVVTGIIGASSVVLFRHATRFHEGYSREWFVAGVSGRTGIAEKCCVQFCKRSVASDSIYLQEPVVKEKTWCGRRIRLQPVKCWMTTF